ncbi:MAG: KGG domain-containing protein [Hydrogenophaga sp.]|nr:KGG domain-containing protein [Hydrogenophaga sp.]
MATNNQGGNQGGGNQGGGQGRGFAGMDPQRQREIASEGGKAAHASGNAHEFTSEEARAAGSKSHSGRSGSSGGANGGNAGNAGAQQQSKGGSQSTKKSS